MIPLAPQPIGAALRRWRRLHRVKQADLAARLGVAQSTVSRWESATIEPAPTERARIEALIGARLTSAADAELARLIAETPRALHLACDLLHRLLACSPARGQRFGLAPSALIGRSLWRFSTEPIVAAEVRLPALGWREALAPAPIEFDTGANRSRIVPITPSRCRWTRLILSDGSAARLVETL